jgi:hypothetical protein
MHSTAVLAALAAIAELCWHLYIVFSKVPVASIVCLLDSFSWLGLADSHQPHLYSAGQWQQQQQQQ